MWWLPGGDEGLHYECRNCGTSLESREAECPYCDRTEVAVYRV
jgi:rubrerythrin